MKKVVPKEIAENIYVKMLYKTSNDLGDISDWSDLHLKVHVSIVSYWCPQERGNEGKEITLGSARFTIVRVGSALNRGVRLRYLFDVSQEMYDLAAELYDLGSQEFVDSIVQQFPEMSTFGDILYLEHLGIRPFARGQNLGLSILDRILQDWDSGCSLVVMQPHPLQFAEGEKNVKELEGLNLDSFSGTFEEATQSLSNYYAKLGFEKMAGTPFLCWCPDSIRPSAHSLGLTGELEIPIRTLKGL